MASVKIMLEQVSGLLGTQDLTEWEHDFVEDIYYLYKLSGKTVVFSGKQVEVVERIWKKHFA